MKHATAATTHSAAPVADVAQQPVEAAASGWHTILHSADTWITVSFLIFAVLAIRYVWPMIGRTLDTRAEKIRDQLEQASRLRAEAEALLATYQQQQQEMLKEAEAIVTNAQRDAAELRTRAAEELKQAIDRRSQQAQEKIARAEAEAIDQLRKQIVETAITSARDMVGAQLASESEDRAVERAIAAITQQIH